MFRVLLLLWSVSLPLALAALPSDFFYDIDGLSVDVSRKYFCVLEQALGYEIGGKVRCFGDDKIVPPDDVFVQVSTSSRGACGITLEQNVKCWGSPTHMHEEMMQGSFTQISGGENVICGLRINGVIACVYGKAKSFQIAGVEGNNFVQISCGHNYCCVLDNEGLVTCRGDVVHASPLKRDNLHQNPHVVMEVGADGEFTVAPDDVIPDNEDSEEYEDFMMNPRYAKHPMKFKQIAVSHGYMCGIQYLDENIFCWGNDDAEVPVTQMNGPFRMVSAADHQVCGILKETNKLKCAYENPLSVMDDKEWDQIKVGSVGHICGVTMNSELICRHANADPEILDELIVA